MNAKAPRRPASGAQAFLQRVPGRGRRCCSGPSGPANSSRRAAKRARRDDGEPACEHRLPPEIAVLLKAGLDEGGVRAPAAHVAELVPGSEGPLSRTRSFVLRESVEDPLGVRKLARDADERRVEEVVAQAAGQRGPASSGRAADRARRDQGELVCELRLPPEIAVLLEAGLDISGVRALVALVAELVLREN